MAMSRSFGGTLLTTRSPMRISPEVMFSSPAIMRSRVDLPQPDGPTSTTNSPSSIRTSTPWMTSIAPNAFLTSRIATDAMRSSRSVARPFADALARAPVGFSPVRPLRRDPGQHSRVVQLNGITRAISIPRWSHIFPRGRGRPNGQAAGMGPTSAPACGAEVVGFR